MLIDIIAVPILILFALLIIANLIRKRIKNPSGSCDGECSGNCSCKSKKIKNDD